MTQRTRLAPLGAMLGILLTGGAASGENSRYACDGSAIASAGVGYFWNASDEDNILRLYRLGSAAKPVHEVNLNSFLRPELKKGGEPKEADIEAVAPMGKRLYWIGSHGLGKKGIEPSRRCLFATDQTGQGPSAHLEFVGKPFTGLVDALKAGSSRVSRQLNAASPRDPHDGWLNIEGLAADGASLLIGFRSPLVDGRAVVIRLLNPAPVVEKGAKAELGDTYLLDLGGRGVRDLAFSGTRGKFWVLAGDAGDRRNFALFRWSPGGDPVPSGLALPATEGSPEGLMQGAGDEGWFLATDRGDGCKEKIGAKRFFEIIPLTIR